jgi:hypothetical protein
VKVGRFVVVGSPMPILGYRCERKLEAASGLGQRARAHGVLVGKDQIRIQLRRQRTQGRGFQRGDLENGSPIELLSTPRAGYTDRQSYLCWRLSIRKSVLL